MPDRANSLTVVSWGGAYEQSQVKAFHEPWTAESGVPVTAVSYNGSLDELRAQVNSNESTWDIVDMEPGDASLACSEGLIVSIDKSRLKPAPDGTSATEDFFPDTLFDCAVSNIIWSNVIVYNTNSLTTDPSSVADFFDTTGFPGNRGIQRSPQVILELALMADGVIAENVYTTLSTEAGIDRAFIKIDTIKENIVWWTSGAESMEILNNQTVVMGTSYSARAFNTKYADQSAVEILWDAHVWNVDVWVLPRSSTRQETAYNFLAFATGTEPLADQSSYIAYGPARRSSQELVGNHIGFGVDMKPHIPTSTENFQNALQFDVDFWNMNGDSLGVRFEAWLQDA